MIKDTDKYADGEDEKVKAWGKETELPFSLPNSPHMFTNPESLQTLTSGVFIEASLQSLLVKSSAIDNGFKL